MMSKQVTQELVKLIIGWKEGKCVSLNSVTLQQQAASVVLHCVLTNYCFSVSWGKPNLSLLHGIGISCLL